MIALTTKIEQARSSFAVEAQLFAAANQIDSGLRSAHYFSQAAVALAEHNVLTGVRRRLQIVASSLDQVRALMLTTFDGSFTAHLVSSGSFVIGPADSRSSASLASALAPSSLALTLGDATISPFSFETAIAVQTPGGELPFELAGVTVTIAGRAAPLVAVSPSQVNFCVPQGVSAGEVEVIVTSQAGTVSRGTTTVLPIAPAIFTHNGNGIGEAVAMNASTYSTGPFRVTTESNFGSDRRTRLMIFATGIGGSGSAIGGEGIQIGETEIVNLAQSVTVEARLGDGQLIQLPVEFAGRQGQRVGLDQINVILPWSLSGAGTVELTIIVGGQRSNTASVRIL